MNDNSNENNDAGNYRVNNKKIATGKYFEYKTKIIGRTLDNNSRLDADISLTLFRMGLFGVAHG